MSNGENGDGGKLSAEFNSVAQPEGFHDGSTGAEQHDIEQQNESDLTTEFNRAAAEDREEGDPPPELSLADGPKPPEDIEQAVRDDARKQARLDTFRSNALEITNDTMYNRENNNDRDIGDTDGPEGPGLR